MKIAIISDIHGNMQALEAVLEDIRQLNCEKIFCLGDLAMAGPQPNEAIERIKQLLLDSNFELIQGNTDEYLAENSVELGQNIKKTNPIMGEAYFADLNIIKAENIEFLKNIQKDLKINLNSLTVHFVHGSPRANNENIYPGMPIEKVEEMISSTDADLIFCGHTHQPCGYQTNTKQTVVNVGSVGRPLSENPKACYAILELVDGSDEFYIEHRLVDYDKATAALILNNRGFEGSDKLAQMLITASERYPS